MTQRRAIVCLALGETIVWAGMYYLFPALLLRWEAAEGWSKTGLTAAFAGAVIVSAVVSPMMGRLIDRGLGPKVMVGSALSGACFIALLPLATELWMFNLIWLAIGAAMGGCLYEPCFALVTRALGGQARRAITLISLIAGFAGTLSFPLNHAMAEWMGWQAATATFAVLMVTLGAPLIWLGGSYLERNRPPDPAKAPQVAGAASSRTVRDVVMHPVFWALAGSFAMLSINHGVVLNHLLPILNDREIATGTAVLAASMIGPMQVAGRLAMMAFERHVSSHAITFACFVSVSMATVCLYLSSHVPALIVVFVVLQGSGWGVISIMRPVILREIVGETNFGAISGAMAVPYLAAAALSPFLGSLLWEAGGYDLALVTVFVLSLVGLISYRVAAAFGKSALLAGKAE